MEAPVKAFEVAALFGHLESDAIGPYENCHETIDIAFRLGREAVAAKNKSRFVIYQLKKFMGHAYAWHGEDFQHSVQELTAAVEMVPYDPELRASSGILAGQRRPVRQGDRICFLGD